VATQKISFAFWTVDSVWEVRTLDAIPSAGNPFGKYNSSFLHSVLGVSNKNIKVIERKETFRIIILA
jgi:hypothetical protein